MTINFQQVNNNNPFVVGQIGGSYNTGVSVGDIKELYELLGYSESEDIGSQLLSSAGFSVVGAAPEIIKSIKYSDDVKAANELATGTGNNKMQQFILSNRYEDLLIGETKAYNSAQDGKNWFTRIFSIMRRDGSSNKGNILDKNVKSNKATTNMATNGVVHDALKITKDSNGNVNIGLDDFTSVTKLTSAGSVPKVKTSDTNIINNNMQAVTRKLAETAGENSNDVLNKLNNLSDIAKIDDKKIKDKAATLAADNASDTAKALGKAASSSVSNIKTVSKSVAKEAFGGWGLAITAITGLTTELPSIITAFKESSSEGWTQLGKSAATIGISDVLCSAGGQVLGGTIGFAIGGLFGPVGASIGGAIGKTIGASVGSILGRQLSSWIFGKSTTEQQQEEQIEEQAKEVASSQINLQSFLAQAKQQAAAETDSKKAQQINAKIQAIENKLNPLSITSSNQTSTSTNPFVNV